MDTVEKQIISNSPSLDEEFINECIKDINDNIEECVEEVKEEVGSYEKLLVGEDIMWTSNPRVEIKREVTDDIEPTTLYDILSNTVSKYGNLPAYTYDVGNQQVTKTWSKFYIQVRKFARSLIACGLDEYSSVMIQGFNSYEWVISHFATIFAGGISSGVYTSNLPEICKYMVDDCNAQIIIVENEKQLNKYKTYVDDLVGKVKAFIVWSDYEKLSTDWTESVIPVYSWWAFMKRGDEPRFEAELDERISRQSPWRCHSLIYTSGTTGYPKGVMISHDNISWVAQSVVRDFELTTDERTVSYLPLSHIAAQALDFYLPMFTGSQATFARPDALKGSLKDTLCAVRPTIFFGVPRVWEKFAEKMKLLGTRNGCFKKLVGNKAKKVGLQATRYKEKKKDLPYIYYLADSIVFSKIKKGLGLDKCKLFMTGAAPISTEVLKYFGSLDIQIMNLYGASECCGPITFNLPKKFKHFVKIPGQCQKRVCCGSKFTGEELELYSQDDSKNGEIICKGRHVFMGYINKREKTCQVIDSQGYYHSGDIGYLDNDGFLTITGRIKEILITRGGENIAPVLIENNIKKELSDIISNVVVIGDAQKYLTCLITLKCVISEDEIPTRILEKSVSKFMKKLGSTLVNTEDARECNILKKFIENSIIKANKKAVSNAQTVKKFRILLDDFSVATDELTPTLKLKRSIILKKNQSVIDELYGV
jgi:long-chain-fatty-acid--CoA ligase ACSBG